ncbi:MAG TPA: glycosyltransferase [Pyrinomonadaceae bacterium]|nr:glycosyltransferase [Pyrinomonadaceae bacterium]
MLSIIIASCNEQNLANVEQSISQTVGIPYETVVIRNPNQKYSLAEAYNLGAEKAKFDFLLFVHEDVVFHTKDWGKNLISHFENLPDAGVLGISGTSYKTFAPGGWWNPNYSYLYVNHWQSFKFTERERELWRRQAEKAAEVICLDGVFLAIKKEVFNQIKFDKSIKGFHGYDLDLSLAVSEKYKNYFIPDILLEHFSEGNVDDKWLETAFVLFKKWENVLPKNSAANQFADKKTEAEVFVNYIKLVFQSDISFNRKMRIFSYSTYAVIRKLHIPFRILFSASKMAARSFFSEEKLQFARKISTGKGVSNL